MIDPELDARFQQLEEKIDETLRRTKSIQNYHRWNMIFTILFIVLPLVLSVFVLPYLLNTLSSLTNLYMQPG